MSLRFIIYLVVILLGILQGVILFKKLNPSFKGLVILLIIVFLSEISGRLLILLNNCSFPVYHLLIPFELALYAVIYSNLFIKHKISRLIIIWLAIFFATYSCFNSLTFETIYTFPSFGFTLLSFFVLICVLYQFYLMIEIPVLTSIWHQPIFWFNTGNLIFYCTTFLIFSVFNPLLKTNQIIPEWAFTIIFVANILMYGCYFISLRISKFGIK